MPTSRALPTAKRPAPQRASKATASKARALVATAKRASAADRTRAEALLDGIARRKARIAEDFYDIGEALRELLKKKLHLALGFTTFAEMLKARRVMGTTQAYKLIQLVTSVPREKALAVGSEKAFLLVDYAKATPEPDTPEWLLDQGTLPGGKRVADASTRELTAATKAVRKRQGTSKPKSAEQRQADRAARDARALLTKRGAKNVAVAVVRKANVWWLRIEMKAGDVMKLE
jgi:hypothetical protein